MSMETQERSFPPLGDDAAVDEIVLGFRTRTLPSARWTHQAHLAVGLWHVMTHGERGALTLLRDGIRAYNTASGIPNSDTRGYHETVTAYYVWAAARYLETAPPGGLAQTVDRFVAHPLGSKAGIFRFWSRACLFSVAARRGWVAPDLAALAPWTDAATMDARAAQA